MKSTRKLASILLAVMVASGVFTGCGNSQSDSAPDESSSPAASEEASGDQAAYPNLNLEGFPIVKEPITLKLMGVKQAIQGPWEEMFTRKRKTSPSPAAITRTCSSAGAFPTRTRSPMGKTRRF